MRGNRILTALVLLLAACCTAAAQTFQVKMGGGVATHYADSRVIGAFKAGMAYEYEFNQRWTFSPGLMIYGKGWKTPDQTVPFLTPDGQPEYDEEGNQRMGVMSRSTSANYLEVPLLMSYYLRTDESRYVVFSAGPYVACGLTGKVTTKGDTSREGSEKMYYEGKTFKEPGARRFDAGLQCMVGYQFASSLIVGIETDLGFLKTHRDGERNVSAIISLSYRLGK